MRLNPIAQSIAVLSISGALAACGGGGGDSPQAQPQPSPNQGIISNVASATYSPGSEELAAFTLLNEQRAACGFGKMSQNAQLDATALGMANWNAYHNTLGHFQIAGTPMFTGVTSKDRARAAGYNPAGGFAIQEAAFSERGTFGNDKTGFGAYSVRQLLNGPYHAYALLDGFREVGISIRSALEVGAPDAEVLHQGRKVTVINPARSLTSGSQLAALGATDVLTYPCGGTTGVVPALYGETPNPVPGRDLLNNPLGSSIIIAIKEGHTLTISSASMRTTNTGTAVTLRAPITRANDPHYSFPINQGYIAADAPLAGNTSYTVDIVGANNGVVFTRSFNFTTGPN